MGIGEMVVVVVAVVVSDEVILVGWEEVTLVGAMHFTVVVQV